MSLRINLLNHLCGPQKLLLPGVDRLGAPSQRLLRIRLPCNGPPQSLGHLADRVAPILDVGDCIASKLICEFSSGHIVLLASKITKQGV
jgi:hypothetical protein